MFRADSFRGTKSAFSWFEFKTRTSQAEGWNLNGDRDENDRRPPSEICYPHIMNGHGPSWPLYAPACSWPSRLWHMGSAKTANADRLATLTNPRAGFLFFQPRSTLACSRNLPSSRHLFLRRGVSAGIPLTKVNILLFTAKFPFPPCFRLKRRLKFFTRETDD